MLYGEPCYGCDMVIQIFPQDLRGNVLKLAKFLSKELSEENVNTIVEHCSFKSMKANPMVNGETVPSLDISRSKFIRKGRTYATDLHNSALISLRSTTVSPILAIGSNASQVHIESSSFNHYFL